MNECGDFNRGPVIHFKQIYHYLLLIPTSIYISRIFCNEMDFSGPCRQSLGSATSRRRSGGNPAGMSTVFWSIS